MLGIATRGGRQRDVTPVPGGTAADSLPQALSAVSAAMFYRARRFPGFVNDLFIATGSRGQLFRLHPGTSVLETASAAEVLLDGRFTAIRDIATGPDGNLYIAATPRSENGDARGYDSIIRLAPAS